MKLSSLLPWNWGKEKKKARDTFLEDVGYVKNDRGLYVRSKDLFDVEDTSPSECEPSYYKGDKPPHSTKGG